MTFKLDTRKAISSLLYVVSQLEKADKHKTFKILYFADQKHLVKYGRPIVGDSYFKMEYGPVPSWIKNVVDEEIMGMEEVTAVYNRYYIKGLIEPNLEAFSESEISCLNEAIQENKDLPFQVLTDKSHDSAWEGAQWMIDYFSIAKAGGANDDMIAYIKTQMENDNIVLT
jgi:uncharacterized phage-associated protein